MTDLFYPRRDIRLEGGIILPGNKISDPPFRGSRRLAMEDPTSSLKLGTARRWEASRFPFPTGWWMMILHHATLSATGIVHLRPRGAFAALLPWPDSLMIRFLFEQTSKRLNGTVVMRPQVIKIQLIQTKTFIEDGLICKKRKENFIIKFVNLVVYTHIGFVKKRFPFDLCGR